MVLYRSSMPAGEQMSASTPEQAQAGMEAWMTWAGKAGNALVDLGAPLSSAGRVGKASATSDSQPIAGFSLLEADSADAVKGILDGHPHFESPGDSSIEILEFLPIPGT
jgi:hypothetical protein